MSKRKRRPPRTLLDKLEAEGYFQEAVVDELRKIKERHKTGWKEQLSDDERKYLTFVFTALFWPSNPKARRAHERYVWISEECEYYRARGDFNARKRTADLWGESVRTVDRAREQHPVHYPGLIKADPEWTQFFEAARRAYGNKLARFKID